VSQLAHDLVVTIMTSVHQGRLDGHSKFVLQIVILAQLLLLPVSVKTVVVRMQQYVMVIRHDSKISYYCLATSVP